MKRSGLLPCFLSVSFLLSAAGVATAELLPEQVAIITNKASEDSRKVAAYYAKVRNIPLSNVLQLEMPTEESLSRKAWQQQVRPAIRRWLAADNRLRKIRCFATVWDVPLKIAPDEDSKQLKRLVSYLSRERSARVGMLNAGIETLETMGGGTSSEPALPGDADVAQISERLQSAITAAQQRINETSNETEKAKHQESLRHVYVQAAGLNSLVSNLRRQISSGNAAADPNQRAELLVTQGRAYGLREGRMVVESMPPGLEREPSLLTLIQMTDGVVDTIKWLDDQLVSLRKNETGASFDSELTLVAWPDYQLVRWQPNLLHHRYDDSPIRQFKPTFMVSRLEAPSLAGTRKLIDDSLEVEKTGLSGKIYLDGRGLARQGQDESPRDLTDAYDQMLVSVAQAIDSASSLEVVLDDKQSLFSEGAATDVAFYCGWYSLAKYVDAFDFNPGAVGFHMGGGEAATLRSPDSQLWCKRLLEDGVAATLGPIADGPVGTYPRPNEFLVLLLSGRYTLAECFFRCNSLNSWTMTLIGDPLYSPYKATQPLDLNKLPDDLRRVIEGSNAVLK